MPHRFIAVSHDGDLTIRPRIKQHPAVTPRSVFPYLVPLAVFRKRECERSGYAGAKYYLVTLMNEDGILKLKTADEAVALTERHLLGKSRIERVYNMNWPSIAREYRGILVDLSAKEQKKIPEAEMFAWIMAQNHNLSIWDTEGLDIEIQRLKSIRDAC